MKAAIWARVSTDEQDSGNQVRQLRGWAEQRGWDMGLVYEAEASGWKGQHLKQLSQVYTDARLGRFNLLLVWALDRLSR